MGLHGHHATLLNFSSTSKTRMSRLNERSEGADSRLSGVGSNRSTSAIQWNKKGASPGINIKQLHSTIADSSSQQVIE